MKEDLATGALSPVRLEGLKEKELAERYDASRETVRKARAAVLSEIASHLIPDKS